MALPPRVPSEQREPSPALQAAFTAAMAFPTQPPAALHFAREALAEQAAEECSFGRIMVDDRGITAGTRLHILEPARAVLAGWKQARRGFDVAIEPLRADIDAERTLPAAIEAAAAKRDADREQAERAFAHDSRFAGIQERFHNADARYKVRRSAHGGREANMGAYHPLYWVALLSLGVAEWFINYDIFLMFTGVVAVAAGVTVLMAALLAIAAHQHGTVLRQWSYRFGRFHETTDRANDWRMFGFACFALALVLAAAGGSRYAAVMHELAGQPAQNILGSDAQINEDPLRDVLLSLLWNLMAWAAGVFVAYLVHDKDPDYMDATHQFRRANRRYHVARRPLLDKLKTIDARYQREVETLRNTATIRAGAAAAERRLLEQVEAHEEALVTSLASVTRGAADIYHSALAQLAVSQRGALVIEQAGAPGEAISPMEFRARSVRIDNDTIRRLAA
jgi:hypothetical protein